MLRPGETIAHYKLISAIGKGGMGEVYLAEDTRLGRHVAIKVLLADVSSDADRLRRFVQEAKAASALNHPNILTVYEIGEYGESRYIATEFIKGETLRQRMADGNIVLTDAIGIATQTAAALAAAHDSGILHRDIKPENIMVRNDGLVKVLDFGLAKLTEKPEAASALEAPTIQQIDTSPGLLVGTIAYMSPEQVRGQKLDARTDIFSLGTVMYELFTGRYPFTGDGHLDLASSVLKDEPAPLRQASAELPRQLERIVDKALRKDRETRYQHIKDLKIDLEDVQDEIRFESKNAQSAQHTVPAAATERISLSETISTKRRFTLLHAMIFVAAAVVIIGGVWFLRRPEPQQQRSYRSVEIASWNSAPGEIYNSAAFSPDGKMIAFASTRSGSKNIWVTQTGSTAARQVTNDAFANTDPIWSPKGDEIAYFVAGRKTGTDTPSRSGIWRVPALGGTSSLIADIPDGRSRIRRWTASGKIYYQVNNELYALDAATGTSNKIISAAEGIVPWMDVSPDERSVAYAVQDSDKWRLLIRDLSGNNVVEAAAGTGRVGDSSAWLPERKRLFYSASVDGVLQAFVTNIGSSRSRQITTSETDADVVDASPDGISLIIGSTREESNLWRVGVKDGQEVAVIRDINSKVFPSAAPANDRIVFQSCKDLGQGNRLFETDIVVKDLRSRDDAGRPAQLAKRGFLPAWSHNDTSVAFLRESGGAYDLMLVNGNGGGERKIASDVMAVNFSVSPYNPTQTQAFAWSADDSQIAYISKKNGVSNVWTTRVSEGVDKMLTDNTDANVSFLCPMWSPDGNLLAYAFLRNDGSEFGLRRLDIGSMQIADVYRTSASSRLIGWTADGMSLILAERSNSSALPPETTLRRVDIASHAQNSIAALKNAYFYNIFLSDDRKTIAYAARNDDKDDLWIMPSSGGTARRLTANSDTGLYFSRLAWLHDGSAIVFGKQTRFSLLSMITEIE